MKKSDMKIIGGLIIIAILSFVGVNMMKPSTDATSYVEIFVGDGHYERVYLNDPKDVVIDINGQYNKVGITSSGVKMLESSCDNQDCLKQGEITLENIEERVLGGWIVCLPNQVSVELIQGEI